MINQLTKRNDAKFTIEKMEVDKDHIHIMVNANPNVSATQIIRRIKQNTTFLIWNEFNDYLKKHYWKEKTFWSDGYFVSSIGNASEDTIRRYIDNQGYKTPRLS